MENLDIEKIKQCASYSEAAHVILGVDYYNGKIKQKIISFCEDIGVDIAAIIKQNREKDAYCLLCGNKLKKGQKKFCSSSCAASYNNKKRKLSESTKKKISETQRRQYELQGGKYYHGIRVYECICCVCGKHFFARSKKSKHCSHKCVAQDPEVQQKLRDKQLKLVKDGTHQGWKTRNIKSYAERFWEQVLQNNKIDFLRETHNNGKYFIDFEIRKNGKIVDLEIDGKQHRYRERVVSDERRDEYLTSLGYIVYRIEWNEINTEKGKKMMENKITNFIGFYNSL